MAKILELWSARHKEGKMYQGSAVNAAHGVDKIKEAGDGHPLHYVYPGAGGVSVKDDIVLGEGSISYYRDIFRISEFERTAACLLYTSPSPRDGLLSRMPSSA